MKKIVSCQIFKPYLDLLITDLKNWDITYLEISKHDQPEELHDQLQLLIDQNQNFDSIYLFYGICGNALQGLVSERSPLYCFLVHDCLAVFLSSNERYMKLYEHNIGQWRCEGNFELYKEKRKQCEQEYIELYGSENSQYLMDLLFPSNDIHFYVSFNSKQDRKNLENIDQTSKVQILHGDLTLLKAMLSNEKHDMIIRQEVGKPIKIDYMLGKEQS